MKKERGLMRGERYIYIYEEVRKKESVQKEMWIEPPLTHEASLREYEASNKPGWSPSPSNVTQAAVHKGEMERRKKKKLEHSSPKVKSLKFLGSQKNKMYFVTQYYDTSSHEKLSFVFFSLNVNKI